MRRIFGVSALMVTALSLVLSIAVAVPAAAEPVSECTAGTLACQNLATLPCGDSVPERQASIFVEPGETIGFGPVWRTTTKCRDIQIQNRTSFGMFACVFFLRTGVCNSEKFVATHSGWTVIATDVCDFTDFQVRIRVGQVASGKGLQIWSDH